MTFEMLRAMQPVSHIEAESRLSRLVDDIDAALAALEDAARRLEAEVLRAGGALDGLPSVQTSAGNHFVRLASGGLTTLLEACDNIAAALQDGDRGHCDAARDLVRRGEAMLQRAEDGIQETREDVPLVA